MAYAHFAPDTEGYKRILRICNTCMIWGSRLRSSRWMLIACPLQRWLQEHALMLRYFIHCLSCRVVWGLPVTCFSNRSSDISVAGGPIWRLIRSPGARQGYSEQCFVLAPLVNRAVLFIIVSSGLLYDASCRHIWVRELWSPWLRWSLSLSSAAKTFVRFMVHHSTVPTVDPSTPCAPRFWVIVCTAPPLFSMFSS
jgi:hypothetical protein